MPNRKLVSEQGGVGTFEITVDDRGTERTGRFSACFTWGAFKAYVAGLSDKAPAEGEASPLENVFDLYMYAADLKARAALRKSVAVESTIIKRDGKEIDLMKLPLAKAIAAVNAAFGYAASVGGDPQGAVVATRRKLLEAGSVVEKDGMLTAK